MPNTFSGGLSEPRLRPKTVVAAQDAGATMIVLVDTNGGRLPEGAMAVDTVRKVLQKVRGIQ